MAVGFDPYAQDVFEQGPGAFVELARECPLYHYQGRFDFFIASDYGDVTKRIIKDDTAWTSENGSTPNPVPPDQRFALTTDGPRHIKIRHVIQRGFSPSELKRLSQFVARVANELIDNMLAQPEGTGDFFELFAVPLPARLMCFMLGVPEKDFMVYKRFADETFYTTLNVVDNPETGLEEMWNFTRPIFELINERRALLAEKGLQPDLSLVGTVLPHDFLSRFMCDPVDGEPLNDMEIFVLMLAFITGGNGTTMHLMGNLLQRLLEVPERWEAVKDDPALVEIAIEESLRLDPPVYGMFRSARHDAELTGGTVPADAKVMFNLASANRNPEIWPDPHTFRLDRPMASLRQHWSFGGGTHSCLGASLARMDVKLAFERLVERLPNIRITGSGERAPGFNVFGMKSLPVRWD